MLNALEAPFDDISVRKAVNYAIDKDTLVNTLFAGCAVKTDYLISPSFGEYVNKDAKNYTYDVDRAKQLLADAGWEDTNNDGYLEKDGTTLAMKISFESTTVDFPKVAEYLQSEYAKIGMKVTLDPVEPALLAKMQTSVEYQAVVRTVPIPNDDPSAIYTNYFSKDSAMNTVKNTEIEDLVEQFNKTGDHQERINLHYQIQQLVMNQAIITTIYNSYMIVFAKKSVQDIQAAVHTRTIWGSLSKAYIT